MSLGPFKYQYLHGIESMAKPSDRKFHFKALDSNHSCMHTISHFCIDKK